MNTDKLRKIREKKIEEIMKLYEREVSPETIERLAGLFPMYGGTVIAQLVLDLYDSLVYGEEPKGPNGNQQLYLR